MWRQSSGIYKKLLFIYVALCVSLWVEVACANEQTNARELIRG